MSASRCRAAAALLFLLVLPVPLAAQTTGPSDGEAVGPPIVLTPPSGIAPEGAPADETPAGSTPAAPSPEVDRAPAGIEVDPLGEVATDYGGTLDSASGGLPVGMWRGTDRAFVERLLPALPVVPDSPALRELAQRLLLSSAEAPAGEARLELTTVRAERLAALGNRRAAAALLSTIPDSRLDAAAARLRLESTWLAGDVERACAEVPELIRRFDQDLYFQKSLIFCQAKAGQTDEAALGLGLLREQGHDDRLFFELVDVLAGNDETANVGSELGEPKGLHLAMLAAAGQALPEDAGSSADPDLLAARLAVAPGAERLALTEQTVAIGLVGPDELARLYRTEPVAPDELAAAADLDPKTPHDRAVLYQGAQAAATPAARAGLIQTALAAARRDGGYPVAARIYLDLIERIAPEAANAAFAETAGRALYLDGRYEQAAAWLDVARAEASRNPEAAAAVPVLSLLTRMAGGGESLAWDAATVAAWRQAQEPRGHAVADLRAARIFAILDGLGQPAGPAWRVLADPAAAGDAVLPYPALWFALGDAAAAGRIGETVMLALFVLGPDGPGGSHPVALARALSALRGIGLEEEARAIAFEAALANGI